MITVQDAGTPRTITRIRVKQAGVLRDVSVVTVRDGDTNRVVFAGALEVNAGFAYAEGPSSTLTTNTTTANASGGIPPYSYQWVRTASTGTPSTASNAAMASTSFTKTNVPNGTLQNDTWQVTVTDAVGQTATDATIVGFSNTTTLGGGL